MGGVDTQATVDITGTRHGQGDIGYRLLSDTDVAGCTDDDTFDPCCSEGDGGVVLGYDLGSAGGNAVCEGVVAGGGDVFPAVGGVLADIEGT